MAQKIILPKYTKGEEIFNMVSHIVGGGLGGVVLVLCVVFSAIKGSLGGVLSSVVYGVTMIMLYTMSSIYHGLKNEKAKKVFRVLDHCTIYFLIAGTYTPIAVLGLTKVNVAVAWIVFGIEWGFAALAVTLTAVNLKKFQIFSMICYIVMGWCIIAFIPTATEALTQKGFILMLAGGIFYTIGAILYGIGKKKKYMHSVFHLFVLCGSVLQFLSIIFYLII